MPTATALTAAVFLALLGLNTYVDPSYDADNVATVPATVSDHALIIEVTTNSGQ